MSYTEKAIATPITTRYLGFSLTIYLKSISFKKTGQIHIEEGCGTPYQFYRIGLFLAENKLRLVQRELKMPTISPDCDIDFQTLTMMSEFDNMCKGNMLMPDPLASFVNEIGIYKNAIGATYFHTVEPDTIKQGRFIPFVENIRYSNLRQTVLELADYTTNEKIRQEFREKNPIPGTIWNSKNILMNPDDIMPANYGVNELDSDFSDVQAMSYLLSEKFPKYNGKIDWTNFKCSKAFSVSSWTNSLKISERLENQSLLDYCRKFKVAGQADDFSFFDRISDGLIVRGITNLMGEVPKSPQRREFYIVRNPQCLPFSSSGLSYGTALFKSYPL